jgi:hypothetical protein
VMSSSAAFNSAAVSYNSSCSDGKVSIGDSTPGSVPAPLVRSQTVRQRH